MKIACIFVGQSGKLSSYEENTMGETMAFSNLPSISMKDGHYAISGRNPGHDVALQEREDREAWDDFHTFLFKGTDGQGECRVWWRGHEEQAFQLPWHRCKEQKFWWLQWHWRHQHHWQHRQHGKREGRSSARWGRLNKIHSLSEEREKL